MIQRTRFLFVLAASCLAVQSAAAASFDCARATTATEHAICAVPELGRLDEQMAEAYRGAVEAAADADSKRRIKTDQRAWLKSRNRCSNDSGCIRRAYEERLGSLDERSGSSDFAGAEGSGAVATDEHIREHKPSFDIDLTYPRLTGSDAATEAANSRIRDAVESIAAELRAEYRDLLDDNQGEHIGMPWSLRLNPDTIYRAPRFWAVALHGYRYTGGAHGIPEHLVLVLDRETGEPIPPEGLFRPGSDWLELLSRACYAALAGREPFTPGEEWLVEGTQPKAENFKLLIPHPDGIQVWFVAYQVGPYAIGEHDVTVPYAELEGILNPQVFTTNH